MLAGEQFYRLTAIEPTGRRQRGYIMWRFICECGNIVERQSAVVELGRGQSCGCLSREKASERLRANAAKYNAARATHNQSGSRTGRPTRTFTCWVNMIQRCTNPSHKSYDRYGGRGIRVCARWLNSFENFLADMGEKPIGMEIDRENNDRGYFPDNCRWATRVKNANNRAVNHAITWNGRTQNIKQWAAEIGGSHQAIAYRLKAGWSVEDALTTPFSHANKKRGL